MKELEFRLERVDLPEEELLCYSHTDEPESLGCIGHLRGDFGVTGKEYWSNWFNNKNSRKLDAELIETIDKITETLRLPGDVLASRSDMFKWCLENPKCRNTHYYTEQCWEYRIMTDHNAMYLRCTPTLGDYNFYLYVYDREMLFRHLAESHGMPTHCYSELPDTHEPIMIRFGERGYYKINLSEDMTIDDMNESVGATKAQVKAMEVGSMYGWTVPGADPKNYDEAGMPISPIRNLEREDR